MSGGSREHPAVARVEGALRDAGLAPEVRWLDDAAPTAQAAADALGIPVGAIANSLVFTLDVEPVLVMTSGRHRVDTEWLGARLGGVLARASASVVRSATGQVIGGTAPVGHPAPLRTVVDEALFEHPVVWAAAGHPHTVFPIAPDDLLHITGARRSPVEPGAS